MKIHQGAIYHEISCLAAQQEVVSTSGRASIPQRFLFQSLFHEILLLQKFNDISGKVLKPKKFSLQPQKRNETIKNYTIRNNQQNQTQQHKVNYFDFCFISKCHHISNSRYKLAGLDFQFTPIYCGISIATFQGNLLMGLDNKIIRRHMFSSQ